MNDVEIGSNCNIGQNVFIEKGVRLGSNVTVKNNISLYTGVICEDDVFLGPSCVFTNVKTPRSFISRKDEFIHTIVERGASIGANATIICGNTIGKYSLVAAGSVVIRDVPAYTMVAGNPAVVKGFVCKCGEKLVCADGVYGCIRCGKKYKIKENKVTEVHEG
jgi:UDP-2-acetamido-3-amino-2,3-dideoxy-glucuronate N-acetyltransferase